MNNDRADSVNFQVVRAICEADPTVVGDRIEVDEVVSDREYRRRYVGKLPLHLLQTCNTWDSTVSENADCFRYLLKRFPMAALLVDSEGKTPCDLAEEIRMPVYYQRLIHKATFFTSATLRELNYAERRQALLLAYPKTPEGEKSLLCRVRRESKDLLQLVVSFI
jgi:hypothetical protein